MATVRFSGELKEEVRKRAKGMFAQQFTVAKDSMPSDWGDRIYDRAFGMHTAQLNAVPVEFLYLSDTIEVEIPCRDGMVQTKLNLTNKRAMPRGSLPAGWALQKTSTWNDTYQLVSNNSAFDWSDIIYECNEWQDRIKAVKDKQDVFIRGVDEVMEAYATLAPALKVFPALWDLLPDATKDKHREVKEKVVTRDNTLTVDLGALSAQVAFHKMTR
jgi:hypothetical protein